MRGWRERWWFAVGVAGSPRGGKAGGGARGRENEARGCRLDAGASFRAPHPLALRRSTGSSPLLPTPPCPFPPHVSAYDVLGLGFSWFVGSGVYGSYLPWGGMGVAREMGSG